MIYFYGVYPEFVILWQDFKSQHIRIYLTGGHAETEMVAGATRDWVGWNDIGDPFSGGNGAAETTGMIGTPWLLESLICGSENDLGSAARFWGIVWWWLTWGGIGWIAPCWWDTVAAETDTRGIGVFPGTETVILPALLLTLSFPFEYLKKIGSNSYK